MAAASWLNSIPDGQTDIILKMLDPVDAARLQATSQGGLLARAAASETVWLAHSARIFGLTGDMALQQPTGGYPNTGNAAPDSGKAHKAKATFAMWYQAAMEANLKSVLANPEHPPVPAAWVSAWQRVFRWTRREANREAAADFHLRGPLVYGQESGPRWNGVSKKLECDDIQLPPEIAGMWQVCDGQDLDFIPQICQALSITPSENHVCPVTGGLFGGYAAYDHRVSTRLLSLNCALTLTRFLARQVPHIDPSRHLIFAASCDLRKMCLLDLTTGRVKVGSPGHRNMDFAAPDAQTNSLLKWFEEYVSRLEADRYPILHLSPDIGEETNGICLCPCSGPETSCCVTRGVEVRAAATFMPEHNQGWTYSISLRLVGTSAERGFETCQLTTRTWHIQEEGQRPEQVHGEGVIGLFPILTDGGWILNRESDPHNQYESETGHSVRSGWFRYQSCSGRNSQMKGQFSGFLTFQPGTRRKPAGEAFQARLEPFKLFVPDFIY